MKVLQVIALVLMLGLPVPVAMAANGSVLVFCAVFTVFGAVYAVASALTAQKRCGR